MTRRHDEKGDETVALRVPDKIAAALHAEALLNGTTKSDLMRTILEERYVDGQGCKPLRSFANNSESAIAEKLTVAKTAIEAVFSEIGMIRAGGNGQSARRMA
jgi:hypothetical protein